MKRPICISPHLRCTVCGTSRTVRAAGIYLQTEAPKQVQVSSGWERLGPGREGPPHSPLPLHRPLSLQHLPPLLWQITQPTGDPPGPLTSLFRQVINTSSWAFCPKLSSRPIPDTLCTARRGWRKAEAIVLRSPFQGKVQAPVSGPSLVLECQGGNGVGRAGAQQNGSFSDLFFPSQLRG